MITQVNPDVLVWARKEAGYTIEEISKKINIDQSRYIEWENSGNDVPFGKLKSLANYYKRQVASFFLVSVPPSSKKPKDFRNLASGKLNRDVLLAIRRANYYRDLAREFKAFDGDQHDWVESLPQIRKRRDNEIAGWIRSLLKVDIDSQLSWSDENAAYRFWREAIEGELGILVFQFKMPLEQIHGFCLADELPYCIVTNSDHPPTARSFTLFHELAHIIRSNSSMCLTDTNHKQHTEEWECNSLAGKVLLPSQYLIASTNLSGISKEARRFKVSREAYLRRLRDENLISDLHFFKLLDTIKSSYKKEKKGGFAPQAIKMKASRGEAFHSLILNATRSQQLSYSEGAQALGISINSLLKEF